MSTGKRGPLIESGTCRCCGATKKCRLLNVQYEHMNQNEIYVDMLIDCFGLVLSNMDGDEVDRCVCATCVVRIRDACLFRQQILKCEEAFLKKIHHNSQTLEVETNTYCSEVKIEQDIDDDERDSHDYHESTPPSCSLERNISKEDTNKKISLKPAKCKTKSIQKAKQASEKKGLKHIKMKADLLKNMLQMKLMVCDVKKGPLKKPPQKPVAKNLPKKNYDTSPPPRITERNLDEDLKVFENTILIVKYSYVCPFRTRISHFVCYYCRRVFTDSTELRQHTLSHNQLAFVRIFDKQMPKVDVTRIDCRLCSEKIENLKDFKNHLKIVHNKRVHAVTNPEVIQIKLNSDEFKCIECDKTFQFIDKLLKHYVDHYGRHVCDFCGARFIIEASLHYHIRKHTKTAKENNPCEICGKNFKSKYGMQLHISTVHKKIPVVPCIKCDASFLTHAQRNRHLINVHGDKRRFECKMCDKIFDVRKSLMEHIRTAHYQGIGQQCDVCEQKFVSTTRLMDHKAMHTEKSFRCEYCDKCYTRRKALQSHIKTHANDAKYKCNVCETTFTQHLSLDEHVRNEHQSFNVQVNYLPELM